MKKGYAKHLRKWAKTKGFFYIKEAAEELEIDTVKAYNVLRDFILRGEMISYGGRYVYNNKFEKKRKGNLFRKIYKAMYVLEIFSSSDVAIHAEVKQNTVDKEIRNLRQKEVIQTLCRRKNSSGRGFETVYKVTDRDRLWKMMK